MSDQKDWEAEMGLSEATTQLTFYPAKRHKEEWAEEARRQNYSSLSKYLYDLILEGRSYRRESVRSSGTNDERIEQLEAEIDALETELEREQMKNGGRRTVDDRAFLMPFLTPEYQTLDEILRAVVESGALEWVVRKRIEDKLYYLAVRDQVEYQPGHGWKLEK